MNKRLFLLLVCLFVVMMGFGVSRSVLPFYVRHLHGAGVSREAIAIHTTLLTSIYAFVQLITAPFWGQWSDRVGRRPLILLGIAGSAIAQLLVENYPYCPPTFLYKNVLNHSNERDVTTLH